MKIKKILTEIVKIGGWIIVALQKLLEILWTSAVKLFCQLLWKEKKNEYERQTYIFKNSSTHKKN